MFLRRGPLFVKEALWKAVRPLGVERLIARKEVGNRALLALDLCVGFRHGQIESCTAGVFAAHNVDGNHKHRLLALVGQCAVARDAAERVA